MHTTHFLLIASLATLTAARADASEEMTITIKGPDYSYEVIARAGLLLGGELTPKGALVGETSATPLFALIDTSYIAHPFFSIGSYASVSSADYSQFIRKDVVGEGTMTILSAGMVAKARFRLGESTTLRAGAMLGINAEWASVTKRSGDFEGTGVGLNIAPTIELSHRVSQKVGLSGQIGFVSQPVGTADLGGDENTDFIFPPLFFFAVGGELFL